MAKQTQNKTQPTKVSVSTFLAGIANEQLRKDAQQIARMMRKISGKMPVMWGPSIIGFDRVRYKYESGREGEMGAIGFAPRSPNLNIYLADGTSKYEKQLKKLGPHKTGTVCLYIRRLADIDMNVLEEIVTLSYRFAMSRKSDMPRAE